MNDLSPGRVGEGGDFVYYDPERRVLISAEEAQTMHHAPKTIPAGYPTGHPEIALNSLGWAPPGTPAQADPVDADRSPSPRQESEESVDFPGVGVPGTPRPGTPAREGTSAPAEAPAPQEASAPEVGPPDFHNRPGGFQYRVQPRERTVAGPSTGGDPGAGSSAAHAEQGQRNEAERLAEIKRFLASAGVEDDELEGDEAEVRGYVRALKRQRR